MAGGNFKREIGQLGLHVQPASFGWIVARKD